MGKNCGDQMWAVEAPRHSHTAETVKSHDSAVH